MKKSIRAAVIGTVIAVFAPKMPTLAHHSHAMFDDGQEITLTSTVAAIRFTNPHVYLLLEVMDDNGTTSKWTIEMSTVGNMTNRGIAANTFQLGDEVAITVNPLRNGQRGGNYTRIEEINGVRNSASGNSWAPAP
jgi:hypothetical protein